MAVSTSEIRKARRAYGVRNCRYLPAAAAPERASRARTRFTRPNLWLHDTPSPDYGPRGGPF